MYSTNTWEYWLISRVFQGKGVQENRDLSKKVAFLLKISLFGSWFHYFCREFAYLIAPGGHFVPLIDATLFLTMFGILESIVFVVI